MAFAPIDRKSNVPSVGSSSSATAQKAAAISAMRDASKIKHTGATVQEEKDDRDEMAEIMDDPEAITALRALEPLMHPLERKKFAKILNSEPSPKERAIVWKRRVAGE